MAMQKNTKEEVTYRYSRDFGRFWNDTTLLRVGVRQSSTDYMDGFISINNLDSEKKFIKKDEKNYEAASITISSAEGAMCAHNLQEIMNGNITGLIISHIRKDDNTGVRMDIISEEDGINLYIYRIVAGEVEETFSHNLSNNVTSTFYNSDGEEQEELLNIDLIKLKNYFNIIGNVDVYKGMIGLVAGSNSGRNYGGSIKESSTSAIKKPSILNLKRSTEKNDSKESEKVQIKNKHILSQDELRAALEDDDED